MAPSDLIRVQKPHLYRRFFILFLSGIVLPYVLHAQKTDSIGALLRKHNAADTAKVRLYLTMSDTYKGTNTDSAVLYAKKARQLAISLNYTWGRVKSMHLMGNAYTQINELDSAYALLHNALLLVRGTKDVVEEASLLMSTGNVFYTRSEFDSALFYYNNCIALARKSGDKKNESGALMNIGCIYADRGRNSDALNNYLTALKIEEEEHFEEEAASSLSNIATVYATLEDHKRALEYNNRSLAIFQKRGNLRGTISTLANEGVLYGEMKEYAKAADIFRKAISRADSIGDLYWKYICVVNLAEVSLELGQRDTALALYNEALKDAERTNNFYSIGLSRFGLGKIYEQKGNAATAISNYEVAFSVFRKASMYEQASNVASSLSKSYEQKHDLNTALLYHKYYSDLKDSSLKESNDKKLQQLQFDYELEKKEHKIRMLQDEQQMNVTRADRQRILVYAFGLGLALLMVIVFVLYRSRAMQQKTNQILLKNKQEIKEQVAELELLNQFRNKTFSILSHDLRGPINTFSAVIQLLKDGDLSEEDFRKYLPDMAKRLNSITLLIDNLLNWAKSSLDGGMVLHPTDVRLCSSAEKNIELLLDMTTEKKIAIKNDIPQDMTAWCDPGHFDIVIRNLLVNAVKFSHPDSEIIVSASVSQDRVELSVADKGVGMTPEQVSKLFSTALSKSSYGTAGEKGTGIGLLLSYDYVKANNGTIVVTSQPGAGTTFTLVLPKKAA